MSLVIEMKDNNAENRYFKECAEKGAIVRYMYVVTPMETMI